MNSEAIAYHEAGHAVVAHSLGISVLKATIEWNGHHYGRVSHAPVLKSRDLKAIEEYRESPYQRDKMERLAMICLAGPIAQRRFSPRSWRNGHGQSDFEIYGNVLLRLAGGGDALKHYTGLLDYWTDAQLDYHWPVVNRVAKALLESGTLGREEIERAFHQPKRRRR